MRSAGMICSDFALAIFGYFGEAPNLCQERFSWPRRMTSLAPESYSSFELSDGHRCQAVAREMTIPFD